METPLELFEELLLARVADALVPVEVELAPDTTITLVMVVLGKDELSVVDVDLIALVVGAAVVEDDVVVVEDDTDVMIALVVVSASAVVY